MKSLLLLFLGFWGICAYAQSNIFDHLAFTTGYHYNCRNSFYGGLSFSKSLKKIRRGQTAHIIGRKLPNTLQTRVAIRS